MADHDFDLFVIGGGSGGVRAARIAAGHGARVALAEADRFGGTCVIRGCVPKKLLVYASRFADDFADAAGFGWTIEQPRFDWASLIEAKDREIARLEGIYRSNLVNAGVTVFSERAEIAAPDAVRLARSGRQIKAAKILIATGGTPFVDDDFSGRDLVITSNEAFDLPHLPERIVIVGGGYIAIEFAGIFAGLGVDTTIVYRGDKILRGFDEDLRDALTEAYQKRGIRIVTDTTIASVKKSPNGLAVELGNGAMLDADQVMMATGRRPNVAGLGLVSHGVTCGWNGHVVVDDEFRTNVPGIFAVGDVTDRPALTPVAIRDGHAFADREFGGKERDIDYEMVPTAVFSTPEIGTVGWPEHLAAERARQLDVYISRFRTMRATLGGRDERTLMKLVVDRQTDRLLGCHILGPDAAEIVQMAAIAMRMNVTKSQFDRTMPLHPSAAEELVTMRTKRTEVAKAAE
ncbi:MAG: glutathione-disulfide reductase [Hyphomicrobiaceae bacterium]|nr:glutathione-disulfide reductase [Hyphomicrobiaceae bacterium]